MKKLMIFGLMLSLFAFGGNKSEPKTTYAEVSQDPQTYATFPKGSLNSKLGSYSGAYSSNIVSIKVSNKPSDLPTGNYQKVKIEGCTYTDASGVTTTPAEGVIFAYISEATGSTESKKRYDCVLYADVGKIYANEDASYMFSYLYALERIDLRMLDVSKTTSLKSLFDEDTTLKSVDISTFDTSRVKSFSYMFNWCYELSELDLSHFNTSSATDMSSMFCSCYSLTELDVSSFDTSKVNYMQAMFSGCSALTKLDVSSFDTSKVNDMRYMFQRNSSLEELDLSNFDVSYCAEMAYMFQNCSKLKKLDLSSFEIMRNVDYSRYGLKDFLDGCTSLEYLKSPKSLPADSTTNSNHAITLPAQFSPYSGITTLTAANLADHKVINLPGDKFIYEWKNLRTEGGDNGICAALTNGTESNTKLTKLLSDYKNFDTETKEYVDVAIDKEDVTIGDSVEYFQNVIDGKQQISGNYNGIKDDTGSYMTMSISEESHYLIAIIALLGVLAVLGYYFYNKKRQAM